MTIPELLARADGLRAQRIPFVLATVVRAERPTSARPGDRAIVRADGTVDGFVGGACVAATLRAQSAALLGASGDAAAAMLLRIVPGPPEPATLASRTGVSAGTPASAPGTVVVDNPCLSGGTLEIFLEAVVPATLVHVFGDTPIARALASVGTAAGYDVRAEADPSTPIRPDAAAVVVASHGHDEQPVLRAALAAGVPYLALVASPKRGAAVLTELGLSTEDAARVKTPAGLDIGARTPGEVAVSILAELVSRRPRAVEPETPETTVDPVCGMTVTVAPDTLSHTHAGRTWYFCSPGCRAAFGEAREPNRDRSVADSTGYGG